MKVDPTWRLLERGLYADNDGGLHVDAAEYLAQNGYAPTLENQEQLLRAFQERTDIPVTFELDGKEN
jgi:hypothetical protein